MNKIESLKDLKSTIDSLRGKKFNDFDINGRLRNESNKGRLGHIIEEGVFNKKIDSKRSPDLENLGIELKVTPYIRNRIGYVSKERLVVTLINFNEDYKSLFKESHCFNKLNLMQLLFYEHLQNTAYSEFRIGPGFLFEYEKLPIEDKYIIEQDYNKIVNKIINGKAHEISESDTMYLSACTKAKDSSVLVRQPFSATLAKPRAFALKQSYMTTILNNVLGKEALPSLFKVEELGIKTFEENLIDKFDKFKGLSITEIEELVQYKVNRNAKGYLRSLTSRILGITSDNPEKVDEFKKSGIVVKTIRVTKKGKIKESMSMPAFKINELMKEDWETSTLRNYFTQKKILLVIFHEIDDSNKNYKFSFVRIWNAPDDLIDGEFRRVWEKSKKVIEAGVILSKTSRGVSNNLPSTNYSAFMHVRPHGQNSYDVDELPDGQKITKQSFWLNRTFLERIIGVENE